MELAITNGTVALDLFGFVVLTGTLNLTKQNVMIDDGKTAAFNADVLTLALTASGFVGTGGIVNMSADDHLGLDLSAFKMIEIKNGDWTLAQ